MVKEEIILDFDSDDQPVITVRGVKGNGCKALTSDLERKLGTVTSEQKTKEFYEVERDAKGISNRSGR